MKLPAHYRNIVTALLLLAAVSGAVLIMANSADTLHAYIDGDGHEQALIASPADRGIDWISMDVLLTVIIVPVLILLSLRNRSGADRHEFLNSLALLGLLLLWLARYQPFVYQHIPFLFLLSSTLFPYLAFAVCLLILIQMIPEQWLSAPSPREGRNTGVSIFVAVLMLAIFVAILPGYLERELFAGDQPHYLLVTHSILEDGDIAFDDEYQDQVYLEYGPIPSLEPQSLKDDINGRQVPFHRIGLSVLALPFYAIGGKGGAVLLIVLLAAASAGLMTLAGARLTGNLLISAGTVVWLMTSIPLFAAGLTFMTEVPLLFFVILAIALLTGRKSWLSLSAALLAIWVLPWLHTRGFPVALFLAALLLWKYRDDRVRAGAVLVASVILGLTTPAWNFIVYGEFSLIAQMSQAARSELNPFNALGNSIAILFDSRYGILLHNPMFLPAFPGLYILWRQNRKLFWLALAYTAFALGPGLMYHHWWGGMTPARYLALVMPVAGLAVAYLYKHGAPFARKAILFLFGLSLVPGFLSVFNTPAVASLRTAPPALLSSVSFGQASASRFWPSWFDSGYFYPHALLLAVVFLFAAGCAWLMKTTKHIHKKILAASTTIVLIVVYLLVSPVLNPGHAGDEFTTTEGENDALLLASRYNNTEFTFLENQSELSLPPTGYTALRLFGRPALRADDAAPAGRYFPLGNRDGSFVIDERRPLWAGHYEVRLCLAGGQEQAVTATISDISGRPADEKPLVVKEIHIGGEYQVHQFPLSFERNSWGLVVELTPADGLRFAYAELVPRRIHTRTENRVPSAALDMVATRFGDLALYLPFRAAYPPGGRMLWLAGSQTVPVFVESRAEIQSLKLIMRSGNNVRITVRSSGEEFGHSFGEENGMFRMDVPPGSITSVDQFWSELEIDIEGRFQPVNPNDQRDLGVHIRAEAATR